MTLMMEENPIQLKELSRIYKSTKMNDDGIIVIEYMTYLKQKKKKNRILSKNSMDPTNNKR